ncbi:Outer membrane efflux protein [Pedobacter sp. ok626]|uniref:TolC family protein n=1 Tax=Pedobacter sp. ok626 TaxID=1761882 RepID=UPI0008857874|nr:TolC family protein [Pedobacter sp. ok626]SDJ57243.1 Outer membrane efflux protein [Pedobacter sp. ok626]
MKKLLNIILVSLMFLSVDAVAQESIIPEIKYADLDKYIALAKENYPRRKIFETRKEVIKTGIPMAQVSYLDLFSASYFYRPDQKTALDPLNPYNVNGFQFSVNLNLGNFLQKPFLVKKAKAEYKISQLEEQEYNTQLEMEVKRRYYDYIQQINQLKIYTQSAQDNKEVNDGLRRKFEKGEVTLDVYSQSRINQSAVSTAKIQVEIAYLKAKDLLEEIIGQKLSEVK